MVVIVNNFIYKASKTNGELKKLLKLNQSELVKWRFGELVRQLPSVNHP
jgi:ribosomal protein L29